MELETQLQQLPIANWMSIHQLLNPIDEQINMQQELSDLELIQASTVAETPEEGDEGPTQAELVAQIPLSECIRALQLSIQVTMAAEEDSTV